LENIELKNSNMNPAETARQRAKDLKKAKKEAAMAARYQ
jgi:hypothetical protein